MGNDRFQQVSRKFPWIAIVSIVSSVLVLGAGVTIALMNYQIQLKALNQLLKQQELTDENVSHTRLIIRYIKQKAIYHGALNRDELDRSEYFYHEEVLPNIRQMRQATRLTFYERSMVFLINQFRRISGKPRIVAPLDRDPLVLLYSAYQQEMARNYQTAIWYYDEMLKDDLGPGLEGHIRLHRAFCQAMLGDYEAAKTAYTEVIKRYEGSGIAIAAAILLRYMEEFNRERDRIMAGRDSDMIKGERLVQLLNHRVALKVLESVSARNKSERARLEYYKGVCFEELGSKKEAVDAYLNSIQSDLQSSAARYANRRVYSIASGLPQGEKVLSFSREVGLRQKDQILMEIDTHHRKTAGENPPVSPPVLSVNDTLDEALLEERIEKMSGQMPEFGTMAFNAPVRVLSRGEVNQLTVSLLGKRVRVTTISNEVFSGQLISSQEEELIKIDTLIGPVGIRKQLVHSIVPVEK